MAARARADPLRRRARSARVAVRGRGRGGGLAAAPARGRRSARRSVAEHDYFTAAADRAGRGLPRRPAAADGRRARASRARCSAVLALGRPRGARAGLERLRRAAGPRGAAAAAPALSLTLAVARLPVGDRRRTSAPSTSASRRRRSGRGSPTWPSRRRSAPLAGRRPARAAARAWCGASAPLVDSRRRRGRRLSAPSSPGWPRSCSPRSSTDFERAARGQPAARRGARARPAGRGRHRRGLPGRRQPPLDGAERLRRRPRADQARRPLRQPDRRAPTAPELRSVVAHELGHVAPRRHPARHRASSRSSRRSALLFVRELGGRPGAARRASTRGARGRVPGATRCAIALATLVARGRRQPALARGRGAAPTRFALRADRRPGGVHPRCSSSSRSRTSRDPDPPAVSHFLFGTHPTAVERIGAAVAYERRERQAD